MGSNQRKGRKSDSPDCGFGSEITVNWGRVGPDARLEELVVPSRLDQGAAFACE